MRARKAYGDLAERESVELLHFAGKRSWCQASCAIVDLTFARTPFNGGFFPGTPPSAHRSAENGEFHTVVTEGPTFQHRLHLEPGKVIERDGFVYADALPAS